MASSTSAARPVSSCVRISTWSSSGSSSSTSASCSSSSAAATSARRFGGRSWMTSARSAAFIDSKVASRLAAPCPPLSIDRPVTLSASTRKVSPRRRSRPPRPRWCSTRRTKTRLTTHSRLRSWTIATSSTTTWPLPSRMVTVRSRISASTRVSEGRCSKRRMLTTPVVMTCPPSMLVTRPMGRNTRRRPGTSTTRPTARGAIRPARNTTTMSLTRPTWSPCGSKTARPDRRAMKTLVGAPLTAPG